MKKLKNVFNREISVITRSPEQNVDEFVTEKIIENKVEMKVVLWFSMIV